MSVVNAKEYLKKYNLEDRVVLLPSSTATVKEAAESLKCEEKEIAKTLSLKIGEETILIVMAGDYKIDNAKYRETFHKKATMLNADEVLRKVGHPVGGVCPFGVKEGVKIYLDESLKRFKDVYPACGSNNSVIKISLSKLEEVLNYPKWINVGKEKE